MPDSEFFELDAHHVPAPHDASLFWDFSQTPPKVRPEYQDLTCGNCGRLNELAALERGVSADFVIPPVKTDAFTTSDHMRIVSSSAKDVFEGIEGVQAIYFPIPSSRRHWVVFPKRVIRIPTDAPQLQIHELPRAGDAYRITRGRCKKCNRVRSMTFWIHYFDVPRDVVLAGIEVELARGLALSWVVSPYVAKVTKLAKLSGLTVQRIDPLNQRPRIELATSSAPLETLCIDAIPASVNKLALVQVLKSVSGLSSSDILKLIVRTPFEIANLNRLSTCINVHKLEEMAVTYRWKKL